MSAPGQPYVKKNHRDFGVGDVFEYCWGDEDRVGIILDDSETCVFTRCTCQGWLSSYLGKSPKYIFSVSDAPLETMLEQAREHYKGDCEIF